MRLSLLVRHLRRRPGEAVIGDLSARAVVVPLLLPLYEGLEFVAIAQVESRDSAGFTRRPAAVDDA